MKYLLFLTADLYEFVLKLGFVYIRGWDFNLYQDILRVGLYYNKESNRLVRVYDSSYLRANCFMNWLT